MTTEGRDQPSIETKFVCAHAEVPIGSQLDGWQVVWCEPDRNRVLWHVMLIRRCIQFRGCCG